MTTRGIIFANCLIVSYFLLIWHINYFQVDNVLIGVFRELLTIPFLLAIPVFFGFRG